MQIQQKVFWSRNCHFSTYRSTSKSLGGSWRGDSYRRWGLQLWKPHHTKGNNPFHSFHLPHSLYPSPKVLQMPTVKPWASFCVSSMHGCLLVCPNCPSLCLLSFLFRFSLSSFPLPFSSCRVCLPASVVCLGSSFHSRLLSPSSLTLTLPAPPHSILSLSSGSFFLSFIPKLLSLIRLFCSKQMTHTHQLQFYRGFSPCPPLASDSYW